MGWVDPWVGLTHGLGWVDVISVFGELGPLYLMVYLMADTKWKLSVDHLKLKFYRVFNCICSRCKSQNSELATVELLKSYCLPFLLYASEAVSLSIGNIHSLDNCLHRAVHRIFNVNASDCIADIRRFIGYISWKT